MSHQFDAGKARGETDAMARAKGHNKNADGVYQRHDGSKWSEDPNQNPGTGDLPTDAILARAKSDQRLLDTEEGLGPEGKLPRGQFGSRTEALTAAFLSYTGHEDLNEVDIEANVDVLFTLNQEGGRWSFSAVSEAEAARTRGWNFQHDPRTGALIAIDLDALAKAAVKNDGTSTYQPVTVSPGRAQLSDGTAEFGDSIDLGNGVTRQIYSVTVNGNTTYTTSDTKEDPQDVGLLTDIELGEGRGDFAYLGDGRYEHIPDIKTPFKFGAGDLVSLPEQGGSLVRIAENQYQFVRDTYDPGVKEHTDAQGNVRQFSQSASGTWTELAPRAEPGVVPIGDRDFLRQTSGALAELAPRFDPGIQRVDGMNLFQQRSGQVSQLSTATMDDIITQALIDGDVDKAFAFQDFQNRPTAQESFQTALDFARSPADQRVISALARGEMPVQPPPEGTIQRVGPQPDFLVQPFQDFQRRTQAGRAPTEKEAQALSERAALGQTPLTDTLQMRLEEMQEKMRQGEEIHQAKLQGIIAKGERDAETWRQLFNQKEETFERDRETFKSVGDIKTDDIDPDTVSTKTGDPTRTASIIDEDEDAEWGEQKTEENRLAVIKERTQQALDLGYSAEINPETGLSAAAELAESTPSGTPFTQHAAMSLQRSLEDMGQANALDLIRKGSVSGGVESQLSNLAGLSSALEADPTAELTQAGSSGSSGLKFAARAGGGVVGNREMTVVGEQGPEIAMMPPGTHILPLGKATKNDIRAAQSTGRAYGNGGVVFGDLPIGLQQLQRGRPITPPRGYLFQQGGLTMPSAQALQNLTPGTRESFYGMAGDIGISPAEFRQELQTATPRGSRLPTSRMLPLGRRGVR